jgi:hypothetical protein
MDTSTQSQAQSDLFSQLSLQGLSEDKKNELLLQFDQLVEARVALAISEKLSEEANNQLDGLVESGTPEQVLELIKQHIPDYDELVNKIAQDSLDELVNNKVAVLAEVERLRGEAE